MGVIFKSNTGDVLTKTQEAINRALEICGGKAETYAKMLCPVDTGNLRNSITHEQLDEHTEVIGTNVKYAPFVELGTARYPHPRPYLRPAAENHSEEYKMIVQRELKNA